MNRLDKTSLPIAALSLAIALPACGGASTPPETRTSSSTSLLTRQAPFSSYSLTSDDDVSVRLSTTGLTRTEVAGISRYRLDLTFEGDNDSLQAWAIDPGHVTLAGLDHVEGVTYELRPMGLPSPWPLAASDVVSHRAYVLLPSSTDGREITALHVHWGAKPNGSDEPRALHTVYIPLRGHPQMPGRITLEPAVSPRFYDDDDILPTIARHPIATDALTPGAPSVQPVGPSRPLTVR